MYPRKFPPRRQNAEKMLNEFIRAREVRAVFPDVHERGHANRGGPGARRRIGSDRVLIAPTAVPIPWPRRRLRPLSVRPEKKQHDAKKKQHVGWEELKFRPTPTTTITTLRRTTRFRFLQDGNRVKAVVQFRGPQIAHADLGKKLMMRFAGDLTAVGSVEGMPRLEGRNARTFDQEPGQSRRKSGYRRSRPPPRHMPPPQSPPRHRTQSDRDGRTRPYVLARKGPLDCVRWRGRRLRRRHMRGRRRTGGSRFSGGFDRADQNVRVAAFQAGHAFDRAIRRQVAGQNASTASSLNRRGQSRGRGIARPP